MGRHSPGHKPGPWEAYDREVRLKEAEITGEVMALPDVFGGASPNSANLLWLRLGTRTFVHLLCGQVAVSPRLLTHLLLCPSSSTRFGALLDPSRH